MRYLLLLVLASIAMVACGNSDAPDCTSGEAASALHSYLLDAEEYSIPVNPKLQHYLMTANLAVSNFRTTSQDAGLHASRCVATVKFVSGGQEVSHELPFSDHLPGDQLHVIDANLTDLKTKILTAAQ
jgi:hypothetical protein